MHPLKEWLKAYEPNSGDPTEKKWAEQIKGFFTPARIIADQARMNATQTYIAGQFKNILNSK